MRLTPQNSFSKLVMLNERTSTVLGGENFRYGYQGSEKDNEVKGDGNSYTTEFRQLDPRLGRWLTIDPKASAFESPYVSMGNNPILQNDPLGDTIKVDPTVSGNKNLNTAYERWAKTTSGKKFIKKYEVGGKFEHISIVFKGATNLDEPGEDVHGNTVIRTVNRATGKESENGLPDVNIIPNGKDLVNGKDKVDYLRFNISLDLQDFKKDPTNYCKAMMVNTIVHETQHLEIEMEWLGRQNQIPGRRQQHDMMYGGNYKKERMDSFREVEDLWIYDYNNKWKNKRGKNGYIEDHINKYD